MRCILASFAMIFAISVHARFGSHEEAAYGIDNFTAEANIKEDGSYTVTHTLEGTILRESAKDDMAHYRLFYNGDSEKIEIIEAATINGSEKSIVDKDMIEDKAVADIGVLGFDEQRQITIAFPKVDIGSKAILKYKFHKLKPNIDKFFENFLPLGSNNIIHKMTYKITSKLPLYLRYNDPSDAIKIEKDKEEGFLNCTITLKKPVFFSTFDEANGTTISLQKILWISLSSTDSWKPINDGLCEGYYRVIDSNLPETLRKIKEKAEHIIDSVEQINCVISELIEAIRYMGDWRSVAGRFLPRDIEKICSTKIGDCKDLAASAGAILSKLGYKVQPCLVERGFDGYTKLDPVLPGIWHFNHAIIKVTDKHNIVRWIDPTNIVAMADGIFADIANKEVLVLDKEKFEHTIIPAIDPEHARTMHTVTLNIKDDTINTQGEFKQFGENRSDLAGTGLYRSDQEIKNMVFRWMSDGELEENEKICIELPDLKSRIVKDIIVKYEFNSNEHLHKTNTGKAIELINGWLYYFVTQPAGGVNDLITKPFSISRLRVIKDIKVKGLESFKFDLSTPWFDVTRRCEIVGNDTYITDACRSKKSVITREELDSECAIEAKRAIQKNFSKVLLNLSE